MNRNTGCRIALAVCLVQQCVCISARILAADIAASARKIMEDVYRQDTSHDITMKANFQVFDKQGHSREEGI